MRRYLTSLLLASVVMVLFTNCNKSTEFSSPPLKDYMNLEVGKHIIYRLDSTQFTNFGQTTTYLYYQAMDEIDAAIVDNMGRPAFRVIRYLRDSAGLGPWVPNTTYMIVPTEKAVEVVEENFRFLKLMLPINEGFNWKGNTYINLNSGDFQWEYGWLEGWDYTYANVNSPFTVFNNQVVDSTITVNQIDEISGNPNDPNSYSQVNYSVEVYGKSVGLIFKEFLHWEYQMPSGGNPGYKIGYGIKLNMISHN